MTSRHPTIREVLAAHASEQRLVSAPTPGRPVIAMSREPGSRGRELALALGDQLDLQVYDREIIHKVAESTHLREQTVAFLDEKPRSLLTDWMSSVEPGDAYLSPYVYFQHLVSAIKAIARHGAAVILGRGAHLILAPGQALRVLVTAPHADRVRTVASREGVDLHEAQRRIAHAASERRAFLEKYFRVHGDDPSSFDLVVNTAALGIAGSVDVVRAALPRLGEGQSVARTG
jgi:Cytidylate kinase-like family